jgi:hypothetical protein
VSAKEIRYKCREHHEYLVISAALQLLTHFKLPAERNDRDMYCEHPERWPLTERSLRQPSGKRGKGFDGLTFGPREWLKYGACVKGPATILFGLKVLAWWHRDVWNTGMGRADHKTFADYMRWLLADKEKFDAHLSEGELVMLRELYQPEEGKLQNRRRSRSGHVR